MYVLWPHNFTLRNLNQWYLKSSNPLLKHGHYLLQRCVWWQKHPQSEQLSTVEGLGIPWHSHKMHCEFDLNQRRQERWWGNKTQRRVCKVYVCVCKCASAQISKALWVQGKIMKHTHWCWCGLHGGNTAKMKASEAKGKGAKWEKEGRKVSTR